jgi:1-deoxy-D-xylulose-5-phosphate synthase
MGRYLDMIDSPSDLRKLSPEQLEKVADEVREEIIHVISATGGHLGASLGTVELTVALHYVFESPVDKIVWDVGHQAYPHKLLTGRKERFPTIRQYKGLSGFLRRDESEHDVFGAGHASTALSAALGMAAARDHHGDKFHVVAVVGDGGLTGGMAFEALNNAGDLKKNFIVIVNDNEMSISPNVGAMTKYLTRLTSAPIYRRFETDVYELLGKIPAVGHPAQELAGRLKESLTNMVVPTVFFEELGFKYFGPIDGHNLDELVSTLRHIKDIEGPVVLHALTRKGKGYKPAEADRLALHGVTQFDKTTGAMVKKEAKAPTYSQVFADALIDIAEQDPNVIAISAAMIEGTGLRSFEKRFPDRIYDVGIAEQHAVTFAAGMACEGMRPVCAIYSTFLQRAFDQVVHDVCLQDLDVTFVMDRAGLAGDDGATHHGVFDMAWMRTIPGMVLMAPKDEAEARDMIYTAVYHKGPAAVRIPRGEGSGVTQRKDFTKLPIGEGEIVRDGADVAIIAIGAMVDSAVRMAEELERAGVSAGVVNARFVKPLDEQLILERARRCGRLVVIEEHSPHGGFGAAVLECLAHHNVSDVPVLHFALPDRFVHHGTRDLLFREVGLDVPTMVGTTLAWLRESTTPATGEAGAAGQRPATAKDSSGAGERRPGA